VVLGESGGEEVVVEVVVGEGEGEGLTPGVEGRSRPRLQYKRGQCSKLR